MDKGLESIFQQMGDLKGEQERALILLKEAHEYDTGNDLEFIDDINRLSREKYQLFLASTDYCQKLTEAETDFKQKKAYEMLRKLFLKLANNEKDLLLDLSILSKEYRSIETQLNNPEES